MTPKVPIMEIGTATLGIRLALALRRNRNTTNVTRRTAITSVSSVSCSEARIVVLRSTAIATSMAAGMAAFRWRQFRFYIVDRIDDVGVRLTRQNDKH